MTVNGLKITYNYRDEKRRLSRTLHLLTKLESVDKLVALSDEREYNDREWKGFEINAIHNFSEVVSNLNNTNFILEYSHIIEGLVQAIRDRQDEGKFVQAEEWNNLFNHYEVTRLGLK